MKRFKNLVIGGIQSKVFNLILFAILLLTAAFAVVSVYHSNMLSRLTADSERQQQDAISEIAGRVMDQVVTQSLKRSNLMTARITDGMFDAAGRRVTFVADLAAKLFASPDDYPPQASAAPDPADDGKWTAKVIYADGVDPEDPVVKARVGLIANLSDTMISLCPDLGAADMYIALPEGVHFSVSDSSSSWFTDGKMRSYDPRVRDWYRQAEAAGRLIFTDGEWDATTGAYCVECAMPVYGPDGSLRAVVGADLFLNEMQQAMSDSALAGEYTLLVNEDGCAVLPMQAEVFPMPENDRTGDLRVSDNVFLAKTVRRALQGMDAEVTLGKLSDGMYYVAATPIRTTGWMLLSAFAKTISDQPAVMLSESIANIQGEAQTVLEQKNAKSQTTAIVLLLAVMAITLGAALALGRHIVKPLNTIVKRISLLREGDLEFRMEDAYRTGDEVEELAQSFATLSHKTVEYVETVRRVTAEKERIGAELSLATQIEAAMMPHIFPAFPDRSEFDIFATMDPAKEVGGDFYDYFLIDSDHLCMVVADVSGKGVPAALFMMASKIILQSVAMLGASPAKILEKTNEAICSNNEAQMFVTVWLGILELSTGRLVAANAGHEYPVLKRPGGDFELYKDKHGFVIGGMEGVKYREYELMLEPGARLFVYTDGVPEATNAEKELFGTERMVRALNGNADAAPVEILRGMRGAVDAFVRDAEQFDDLTMLCLEYKGVEAQ